jgi:hypothetical protein
MNLGRQLRDIDAPLQMVGGGRSAPTLHEELHPGWVLGARKSKTRRIAEGLCMGCFDSSLFFRVISGAK